MKKTRDSHCIVGPPESGKTTLAERIFRGADRALAIGYDHDDTYGAVVCDTIDEVLSRMYGSELFRLVYYPASIDEFEGICQLVLQYQRDMRARGDMRQFCFLADELARYPAAYDEYGTFAEFCRQGRHDTLDLIIITQYPLELPLFARTGMTHYYIFPTIEQNCVEFVRKMFGRDRAEQLKALPEFTALTYDRRSKIISPPLAAPAAAPLPTSPKQP